MIPVSVNFSNPKEYIFENPKNTTYNTAIYSSIEGKEIFVRNNKPIEILVTHSANKITVFDFIRDEPKNEYYFEVSINGYIYSINRKTLKNEHDDNIRYMHNFSGGDYSNTNLQAIRDQAKRV